MKAKTLIQSLDRAFEILEIIRDSGKGMRCTAIAKKAGLPLQTAHNLIRSLLLHGYLMEDEEKNYWLGPECFTLSDQAKGPFFQLAWNALPHLRKLSNELKTTAIVGVEFSNCLYCVAAAFADGYSERNGRQRWLYKIHATAAGRVLWAEHDDEELKKILSRKFTKYTPFTRTTYEELMDSIRDCRQNGYSIVCDEHAVGNTSLAIPVRQTNGKLLGALVVNFTTERWKSGEIDLPHYLELMHRTAAQIDPANQQFN